MTPDPERLYLEPGPGAPDTGRLWCEDDVWDGDPDFEEDGPTTEYVRADVVGELASEIRELRAIIRDSIPWVAKLAADAPEGMVGNGAVIRRHIKRMEEALPETGDDDG